MPQASDVANDIIGMEDMIAIYEVTDLFGIDRETISVPLGKEGSGAVEGVPGGPVEVTAPASTSTREWLPALKEGLESLGFQTVAEDEEP